MGHTDQLIGDFHGDFCCADEQELRLRRHFRHQLHQAVGIGIVQRCIDLIEQTERRRIENSANTSAVAVKAFSPPESK